LTDSPLIDQIESIFEAVADLDADRKHINAVVAAANIIEVLCATKTPMRMTALSRELDIAPSSCFNILRTLTQEGIVRFDRKGKTYAIDLGLVAIARSYLNPGGSLRVVGPLIEEFARQREITVVVWKRTGHHMMVVTYFDNGSAVRVHIEPGARFPLLAGAMGRVMAARGGLSTREIKQYFARVKWDKPISFDEFIADAEAARERGYSYDSGMFNSGIQTISTAIAQGDEDVDAVLSATMFAGQHDRKTAEIIASELGHLAKLIASVRIGRSF